MANAKALVLPESEVVGDAPVHFGGFPGVWYPGQPVEVSALGFASVSEARQARDEHAAVLKEVSVAEGSAPLPPLPNHVERTPKGEAVLTTAEGETLPVSEEPGEGLPDGG